MLASWSTSSISSSLHWWSGNNELYWISSTIVFSYSCRWIQWIYFQFETIRIRTTTPVPPASKVCVNFFLIFFKSLNHLFLKNDLLTNFISNWDYMQTILSQFKCFILEYSWTIQVSRYCRMFTLLKQIVFSTLASTYQNSAG